MSYKDQLFGAVIEHRRLVVVVFLALFLIVGSGMTQITQETAFEDIDLGSEAEAKQAYIEDNFSTGDDDAVITQVIVRNENTLSKQTLLSTLELQQEIRTNETVSDTLRDDQPTAGIANVVAQAAIRQEQPDVATPTLDQQIAALEQLSQREIDAIVSQLLDEEQADSQAFDFMPDTYEPSSTNASATMLVVFQTSDAPTVTGSAPDQIIDSQLTIEEQASSTELETSVIGNGIITQEIEQSREDTFSVLGPLALVLVLVILVLAYRDLVDIVLSFLGILLVQVWTFGMLGWIGIPFNAILVGVPVLLIGLSIDYGIHVFMRYREHRHETGNGITDSMSSGLAGVGVALVWVTVTTTIGFLSNFVSPIPAIKELGLIAGIGILGAFVVFGLFIPPLKAEVDSLLERLGVNRDKPPIGTGGSVTGRVLSVGSTAAKKAPIAVVLVTLVLTAGTTVAATNVDTSWGPEDQIVEDAPAWTEQLPEQLEPGEYTVSEDLSYANEHFVRHGSDGEILVEGAVTESSTLQRLETAESTAAEQEAVVSLANGEPRTKHPLTVMERVADENEAFAETFAAADTTGDGIPDQNIEDVYDELFAVAPDAASEVLYRDGGEYEALRMTVTVNPGASGEETTDQLQTIAAVFEDNGQTATATGEPIIGQIIEKHLLETTLTSLLITIVSIVVILAVVYRLVHGSATLGIVTLLPVIATVSWIIGTMYVLGYPLSLVNTIIASLAIGIGIDYSIHVSERFSEELDHTESTGDAITRTVRGTGAALLGSATTTAAGFGVLTFGVQPSLQQFGLLTAIMIGYAFVVSVFVLPSVLVLWARYFTAGPTQTLVGSDNAVASDSPGD